MWVICLTLPGVIFGLGFCFERDISLQMYPQRTAASVQASSDDARGFLFFFYRGFCATIGCTFDSVFLSQLQLVCFLYTVFPSFNVACIEQGCCIKETL